MTRPDRDLERDRFGENENQRKPSEPGRPPRPATEPPGAEKSTRKAPTEVDPGSGEPLDGED